MSKHGKKEENGADTPPRRVPLPEWLAVHLDIPPDLLENGLRAELRGREALTVHGCRAIAGYEPTLIRLRLHDGELIVRGQRLVCTSYLAGAVGINGHIDSIGFSDAPEDGAGEGTM